MASGHSELIDPADKLVSPQTELLPSGKQGFAAEAPLGAMRAALVFDSYEPHYLSY
jgi:hypothetical protein